MKPGATPRTDGLDPAEIDMLRQALLVGLASFGEIERLTEAHDLAKIRGASGIDDLRPIHPTAAVRGKAIRSFSDALRLVEGLPRAAV